MHSDDDNADDGEYDDDDDGDDLSMNPSTGPQGSAWVRSPRLSLGEQGPEGESVFFLLLRWHPPHDSILIIHVAAYWRSQRKAAAKGSGCKRASLRLCLDSHRQSLAAIRLQKGLNKKHTGRVNPGAHCTEGLRKVLQKTCRQSLAAIRLSLDSNMSQA